MDFLLLVMPGIAVFLGGICYGVWRYFRDRRVSIRAAGIRQIGLAWILLASAGYIALRVFTGSLSAWALLAVPVLLAYGALHLYLALRMRRMTTAE